MNKDKLEILIADDEGEMRALLASVLRSCGFLFIHHASNGAEALRMLGQKDHVINIAFLDITMPGMSGIDVLKQAKQVRPDCFCVIVSGHSDLDNVRGALEAGARGFIVKPYNTQKILDVLTKFEKEMAPP